MDSIPDYSKYKNLEELCEAYGQVDIDKHPERLEVIIEEIEKRKQAGEIKVEFENKVILTRVRLFSYLIDLFIHRILIIACSLLAIAVIESFTYAVFKKYEMILFVFSFFIYFLFFEGRGKRKVSLGKTFLKLNVVNLQGEPASFFQIFIRTSVFTLIFFLNWGDIFYYAGFDILWMYILNFIQVALILYNLWLVKYSSDGFMMHDRFSATKVVPIDPETTVLISKKNSPPIEFIKIAFVLLVAIFSLYVIHYVLPIIISFVKCDSPFLVDFYIISVGAFRETPK